MLNDTGFGKILNNADALTLRYIPLARELAEELAPEPDLQRLLLGRLARMATDDFRDALGWSATDFVDSKSRRACLRQLLDVWKKLHSGNVQNYKRLIFALAPFQGTFHRPAVEEEYGERLQNEPQTRKWGARALPKMLDLFAQLHLIHPDAEVPQIWSGTPGTFFLLETLAQSQLPPPQWLACRDTWAQWHADVAEKLLHNIRDDRPGADYLAWRLAADFLKAHDILLESRNYSLPLAQLLLRVLPDSPEDQTHPGIEDFDPDDIESALNDDDHFHDPEFEEFLADAGITDKTEAMDVFRELQDFTDPIGTGSNPTYDRIRTIYATSIDPPSPLQPIALMLNETKLATRARLHETTSGPVEKRLQAFDRLLAIHAHKSNREAQIGAREAARGKGLLLLQNTESQRVEEGIQLLLRVLGENPDDHEIAETLAQHFSGIGDLDRAEWAWRLAADGASRDRSAHHGWHEAQLSRLFFSQEHYAEAQDFFTVARNKLEKTSPEDIPWEIHYRLQLEKGAEPKEVLESALTSLQAAPHGSGNELFAFVLELAIQLQRWSLADTILSAALQRKRTNLRLADRRILQGRWAQVLDEIDDADPELLHTLALAEVQMLAATDLFHTGQYECAEEFLLNALRAVADAAIPDDFRNLVILRLARLAYATTHDWSQNAEPVSPTVGAARILNRTPREIHEMFHQLLHPLSWS